MAHLFGTVPPTANAGNLVSSSIQTSLFPIRSLQSPVRVFTISVIFAASDQFSTSVQLTPLAHHLYTQDLITAIHCTIPFQKKPANSPPAHPELS